MNIQRGRPCTTTDSKGEEGRLAKSDFILKGVQSKHLVSGSKKGQKHKWTAPNLKVEILSYHNNLELSFYAVDFFFI